MTQNTAPGPWQVRPPRFQYSLATLLIVTIVVAVACSVFFAMPVWVSIVATIFLVVSTPMVLTLVLIYGRGRLRTFCLGALFPAGACLLPFVPLYGVQILASMFGGYGGRYGGGDGGERLGILIFVGVYCLFVVGDGLLALWVRRLLGASGWRAARELGAVREPHSADPGHAQPPETPQ